jgi:glycerol-3-phosphate dehydrogenase
MPHSAVLDARARGKTLDRLANDRFDLLVIGGGITGTGAALDAATRGLRVGLIEARDLASGTSSRSSKLIHGGLRYLEQRDFKLVYEALRERDLLVSRLAPHLVKPVSFLYPLYKKVVERPYVGAGLALYDAMEGTKRPVPFHKHLTAKGALKIAPALSPARLAGAMRYYDAQVDDARYTLTVARTAAVYGAVIATRVRAVALRRDGNRVCGALVRDEETGREIPVDAGAVVICAGVWTDLVHELAGVSAGYKVRMSKGVHIVVPREAVHADTGMIIKTEKSVLFFIPWGSQWIVGTTDTDWSGDRAEPAPDGSDIDYILGCANRVLARPLTRRDVIAVYAGLRPLVAASEGKSDGKPTTKLSREHVVDVPVPGLASIAGGKFTTYRLMARDVVDAAVAAGLAAPSRDIPGSVTDQTPLLGADGLAAVTAGASRLAEDCGVSREAVEHLIGRYGTLAADVLDLVRSDPSLGRPLAAGHPYLRAEVAYAVTHEGALHVEDVLVRRVRLFIESASSGADAADDVAVIMGRLLGWSRRRRAAEIARYLDLVAAEHAALADGADGAHGAGLAAG